MIETFLQAMPLTLTTHAAEARDGDRLEVRLDDATNSWGWRRERGQWQSIDALDDATTTIESDSATWWRLCVRMVEPQQAQTRMRITGDARLADAATQILSIIR